MSTMTLEEMQQDSVVMSVAKALKLANGAAIAHGTDPTTSSITISPVASQPATVWQIHYGPRDYLSRRGGDLIVTVDAALEKIEQVVRGQ